MGSSPQYTFYIKKTAEADSTYTQIGSSTSTSVTKGELEQNTSYTIKVEVADVAGNKGQATKEIITGKIADAGEGLTNGAIIASSPVWSDGTASITLSTSSGLTIQYQKGGINGSWTTGTSVTGLHHRDTIFARLTDGKNYGGEASITILDTVIPQDARISLSGTSTTTAGNVTATVTLKDNESGVNATASKWTYNTNSGNIGTNESSYNNNFSSNGQTITLKATTAGTYYLHVLTVDNAGNKKETISNAVKVKEPIVADGSYNAEKGVNTPDLSDGKLTPITWNGTEWVEPQSTDDWYDYTVNKWANAMTEDGSMWVWIPRYAYSIKSGYHNSSSYITGSAGNSASAGSNTGTTNDYTSTQGVKASTTGTVYGVYDMSGGAWEYVAGYVNNGNSSLTSYGSSLVNGDAKTKNVYSKASSDNNTNNYNANSGKYGDAVYETSANGNTGNGSWYGDYSNFPNAGFPFFIRGGNCNNGTNAGVFYFNDYDGNSYSTYSFRPVLVAL